MKKSDDEIFKYADSLPLDERGYQFQLVLYPDSSEYSCNAILDKIKWLNDFGADMLWKYAYILHDKDKDSKSHYHVCIKFKYQKTVRTMLKVIGAENYNSNGEEMVIKKWNKALAYLIHANDPEKYQYTEDEVISNIPNVINNIRHSKDANDIFLEIADYINNWKNADTIAYKDVLEFVRRQDTKYMTVFLDRSNQYIIGNLIKERNAGIIYEKD